MEINKTIYVFEGEGGKNSDNYLTRVEPVGPGFKDPVGTPVDIQPGDVLLKVDNGPWFALFRDVPAAQEEKQEHQRDESTGPGLDKEPPFADNGEVGEGGSTTGDDKGPETGTGTDDAKTEAEKEATANEETKEKQLESATA